MNKVTAETRDFVMMQILIEIFTIQMDGQTDITSLKGSDIMQKCLLKCDKA